MKKTSRSLTDRCFKDSQGNIILSQRANLPLVAWLILIIVALPLPSSTSWNKATRTLAFGALFTWAWLELFQGINYFRRGLGCLTLILLVIAVLTNNIYLRFFI
jgi:hypothetical protein